MADHVFPVEAGHVLAFARAVGDADLAAEIPAQGTVVPATFVAASIQFDPTHMRGMKPAGALSDSNTSGGSVLHAEQHFEYFAPVRVGDLLTVHESDGRRWRKQSRRAGALVFREIVKEYRSSSDELVLRSRMVLVDTEFAVSDEAVSS
ncbi:hypothetical protein B7C42_00095 [Nocardia cerradoensis]|uniref:FAS1-like dehydratase domain-containing protein n=1 Tax=Nocardia cerradoensis TaxID=85688 RepID=A0A231HDN0_9NOCA|nr:MaoC family dehydratase N-terminal domain-containing protein [Nocardia cerradoensis]OXR46979.1 hypothetical protein B7C42_00095 [Nocardia cerradoensis]